MTLTTSPAFRLSRFMKPLSLAITLATASLAPITQTVADATGMGYAPLKPDVPYVFVVHQGRSVKVARNIEKSFRAGVGVRAELMQTSTSCPPFCLQAIQLDQPVGTVGEAEIIDFMLNQLRDSTGVLVDVRSNNQFKYETIPGSINLFIQDVMKAVDDGNGLDAIFEQLGATQREPAGWITQQLENFGIVGNGLMTDEWDFTEAKELIVWSTSATEPSPTKVIQILLDGGYPASKIKWYRGGLAAWQYWGFTTAKAPRR